MDGRQGFHIGQFSGGVRYAAIGSGVRPLVVINGGNAFVRRFTAHRALRDARRIARLLPQDFRVYVIGYDAASAENYSIESNARDIAALIRAEFGAATVVGISFGAFVALRLAAEASDTVRDLIVLIGAHRFSPEGRERVRRQMDDARRGDFEAMVQPFMSLFRRRWLNTMMKLGMLLRRRTLHGSMNPPETIVRMLGAALHEDQRANVGRLQAITARTLVVGGTADQFFDVSAFRETADGIRSAQLELFEHETHMLPLERPAAIAAVIAEFVSRGPATGN